MKKNSRQTNKNHLQRKRERASLIKNIAALIPNVIAFTGIMTSIGLDVVANAPTEVVLTTAGVSLAVGIIGATAGITLEIQEEKQAKLIEKQKANTKLNEDASLSDQGYTFETGM